MAAPLILASSSRYRAQLLRRVFPAFEQVPPDCDERALDHAFDPTSPSSHALRLAREKGRSVARARPDAWVLAGDQIAVCDDQQLHKPGEEGRAIEQLLQLRGREHALVGATVLIAPRSSTGGHDETHALDLHRLRMRHASREEITAYVRASRPLDCAGSYRLEDGGIALFDRIETDDYTGIIGMPLLRVCRLLRAAGLLPGDEPLDVAPAT